MDDITIMINESIDSLVYKMKTYLTNNDIESALVIALRMAANIGVVRDIRNQDVGKSISDYNDAYNQCVRYIQNMQSPSFIN